MTVLPLTNVRGDTLMLDVTCTGITVASMYFSCKRTYKDTEYVFQKSLEDGITLQSGSTYRVRIAPEDTAALPAGKYVYDFQLGVGDDIYTPFGGTLKITEDVTENE